MALPPDLAELDVKIGDFFDREVALPTTVTRAMVISILRAYRGWFVRVTDGKRLLNDVVANGDYAFCAFGPSAEDDVSASQPCRLAASQRVEALCAAAPTIEAKAPLSKAELEAEQEAYLQDLLQTQKTQETQKATQVAELTQREQQRVRDQQEQQQEKLRHRLERAKENGKTKIVCSLLLRGKYCTGIECGDVDQLFLHPPMCEDDTHRVPRAERPPECILWHCRVPPKAIGESKGLKGKKTTKQSSGHNGKKGSTSHPNGSGNSRTVHRQNGNSGNGSARPRTASSGTSSYSEVAQLKDAAKRHDSEMSELRSMLMTLVQQRVAPAPAPFPPPSASSTAEFRQPSTPAPQSLEQTVQRLVAEQISRLVRGST
jgi:hypothetical protein